jgi:hypothetical protein
VLWPVTNRYHSLMSTEYSMGALRIGVLLLVTLLSAASAQSRQVTITEPGVYKIDDLAKNADVVAVVKVLSGDTENYEHAVYKGEVIQSFKGLPRGATVYFGPFVGVRLGWEYVLFLRSTANPVSPKTASASYGMIH